LEFMEDFSGNHNLVASPINASTNEIVSYTIEPSTSDLLEFNFDNLTGTLTLTSILNKFGEQVFYIKADDGQKENYLFTTSIIINIQPVNDAPVINGTSKLLTTEEDTPLEITISDLIVTDPDNTFPDDFTLIVGDGINYSNSNSIITPNSAFVGSLTVPLFIVDGVDSSAIVEVNVEVTEVTGLSFTEQNEQLRIFPNPTTNSINIKLTALTNGNFIIHTLTGRIIAKGILKDNLNIDLSNEPPGIYLLKIESNKGTSTNKFIKN